jgi:hypothetical protein
MHVVSVHPFTCFISDIIRRIRFSLTLGSTMKTVGRTSFPFSLLYINEPGQRSRYSDALRAGDRIPMEARFSTLVQNGPGAHPASYKMSIRSFPEVKRPERGVDHPPHIAPRLKKEYSSTPTAPVGLRGLF